MASLRDWIWLFSWLPSFVVTEAEMTCKNQALHEPPAMNFASGGAQESRIPLQEICPARSIMADYYYPIDY